MTTSHVKKQTLNNLTFFSPNLTLTHHTKTTDLITSNFYRKTLTSHKMQTLFPLDLINIIANYSKYEFLFDCYDQYNDNIILTHNKTNTIFEMKDSLDWSSIFCSKPIKLNCQIKIKVIKYESVFWCPVFGIVNKYCLNGCFDYINSPHFGGKGYFLDFDLSRIFERKENGNDCNIVRVFEELFENDIIELIINNERYINFYYNKKLLHAMKIDSNNNYYFAMSVCCKAKFQII